MKQAGFIINFVLIFILAGCGINKRIIDSGKKARSDEEISKEYYYYGEQLESLWLKKVKVNFIDGERKSKFNAGIRAVKDSIIVIVLRNELGMEGARLFIEKDSICLINRLEKSYFRANIEDFREDLSLIADLDILEEILLTDNIALEEREVIHNKDGPAPCFEGKDDDIEGKIVKTACFNRKEVIPENINILDRRRNSSVNVIYGDRKEIDGMIYPANSVVTIQYMDKRYVIEMENERIAVNEKLHVKIVIPESYIEVNSLGGLWKK